MYTVNNVDIDKFKKEIWNYYRVNKRVLPWRNINDPYKVFVSEIMLQQTQVSRVLKKYPVFIKTFPTFQTLAKAQLSDVLKEWQGMGYNRRARFIHEAAKIIVNNYSGVLPKDVSELKRLPGIGNGTAGSLIVFVYNTPIPFVETNIRRVILHHFFRRKSGVSDEEILKIVKKTMDKKRPREWYYALMDYGSILLKKEKENANIRSATYIKQKPFKGSNREIRGNIISFLVSHPSGTASIIAKKYKKEEKQVHSILNILEKEGLIKKTRQTYRIAS